MSDNTIVSPTTKNSKSVTFHKIEIIELAFAIGDNPSVSCGVPLTMERVAQQRIVMTVDFFETYRPPRCTAQWQLRLGETSRNTILLESGYTQIEIDKAVKKAMRIRRSRRVSVKQHYAEIYGNDETGDEDEGVEVEYEKRKEEPQQYQQHQANKKQPKESSVIAEQSSVMDDPLPFRHSDDASSLRRPQAPLVARSA
jgi:hypothetical protein